MSHPDALSRVIREVEPNHAVDKSTQTLVKFDLTPGRRLFKEYAYYLVCHNVRGEAVGHGVISSLRVDAFDKSWHMEFQIQYAASASRQGLPDSVARRIVTALAGKEGTQAKLETRIRELSNTFVQSKGGSAQFITRFEEWIPGWQDCLRDNICREAAIDLEVRIAPKLEAEVQKAILVREENLKIDLKDYPAQLTAKLMADLASLPGYQAYIKYGQRSQLSAAIASRVQQFMATVKLHDVHFHLGNVSDSLRKLIETLAAEKGQRLAFFKFDCPSPIKGEDVPVVPKLAPMKLQFQRVEYPDIVQVDCELQMKLIDLGCFVANGKTDPGEWAQRAFEEAIQKYLLDVTYIELFLSPEGRGEGDMGFKVFDRKVEETKGVIRRLALGIGFEAFLVAIRTNLQFDELRRAFKIVIQGESFETNVPECPVGLDVEVSARIKDEQIIKDLFRGSPDIKSVIRNALLDTLRSALRTTAPERYYIHVKGKDVAGGQPPLLDELRGKIIAKMKESFKASDIGVIFTQRLTELAKLFDDLVREGRTLDVTDQRSLVPFEIGFRVDSISTNSWHEFQTSRPSMDRVALRVQQIALEWLSRRNRFDVIRDNLEAKSELEMYAAVQVVKEFGLVIKISHLLRKNSREDDAIREAAIKEVEESVTDIIREASREALATLAERLAGAIRRGDYDEIPNIKKLMEDMEKELQRREQSSKLYIATRKLGAAAASSLGGPEARFLLEPGSTSEHDSDGEAGSK